MRADELKRMYLEFFKEKGHSVVSGASLIPENDPTVLFTTAGMHPLVPYLLGQPHPGGKRLCDCQKCIRTGDIDEVGDASHLTFFEMLGNWSLGDYFKEEAIAFSHEFLLSKRFLGFKPQQLFVTVFEGNANVPKDEDSIRIWKKTGLPESHIFPRPKADNWWGLPGDLGPCGPDTEMFIDTGKQSCGPDCVPGCRCGKYFEIWNDVFMQYEGKPGGDLVPLKQHNVDTGMGVERTVAMLQGKTSVYETEVFLPVIESIAQAAGKQPDADARTTHAFRVLADHLRSSVFILGDERGVLPSNLGQGYVLRRLIRRSVRYAKQLGLKPGFTRPIAECIVEQNRSGYKELETNRDRILNELLAEEARFEKTLDRGTEELEKVIARMKEHNQSVLSGRLAFRLYDTCGFPIEFTEEVCKEQGLTVDRQEFETLFAKHREVSKQGSDKIFKGGLAEASQATTRLHTATHLLHQALRTVLGPHVQQKGSNITAERLRFDFSHPDKMTPEQIKKVEDMVNQAIEQKLSVTMETMKLEEAQKSGAMALFGSKYGEMVNVYSIGNFSKEVCGGPHVANTGELGHFKITGESSSSAGVRRIKAVLENA